MLLPENAIPLLAEAFSKLLGKSTAGNMVFARCLLPEIVRTLAANPLFHIDGWQVAAVIEKEVVDKRYITADKAVEWREDKQDATLLLIDPATAGAGMDGIYSAAREIRESELFDYAHKVARNKLPMRGGYRPIVDKALSKARRASQQRTLVPWNVFIYLCYVALDVNNISKSLPIIGLWSIATHGKPNEKELDQSAILIEKIFPVQGSRLTPEQRVEILKLDDSQYELKNQLIDFLRETERLPRLEALSRLEEKEYFYLDQLDLGLFDEQELKSIEWVSWRGKTGKPYTWSGLSLESSTDNKQSQRRLVLFLNPDPDRPRERAHLEVRWKIEPETLPKGTVDYIIQVRTAHDVLAEKTVTHSGKALQKVIFSQDDFNEEELNDNILFEPQVIISTLGEENHKDESEDFILQFGQAEQKTKKSSGKVYPTLSLAITHIVSDGDIYKKLAQQHCDESIFSQDKNGYITCRYNSKVARVHCPPLLNEITKDWIERNGDLGRWQIRVRADGTQVGKPEFIVLEVDQSAERLIETSRKFAKWIDGSQGALGILYNDAKVFNDYVLAANAVWKDCVPELTLIHTLEVVSLAGHRLGMIVLPTHPLRVAWQQSFDLLVEEHRYEKKLSASKVQQLLKTITSAHYPALLPGFNSDETFVFADTLGFHAVALIPANDPEPKATVALLARLLGDGDNAAPTVGKSAATALANEVRRYLQLHENYWRIQVHALRTGDAMPVTRALGEALRDYSSVNNNEDEELANNRQTRNNKLDLCYELNLYPAGKETELTGRFLSNTAERYRNNSNAVSENDRWFMDSISCSGGINIPRLRWAKRNHEIPETPAHLAITFDLFQSSVVCRPLSGLPDTGVLEAHGLSLMPMREFQAEPIPCWSSFIPIDPKGETHPVTRLLTKRQVDLHNTILKTVVRHLGGSSQDWPVLITQIDLHKKELLENLHRLCDWVITADRNVGLEYFDSPNDLPQIYKTYIIDCVPERDDLGFLQLITSTSCFDEISDLLDETLGAMGLSASQNNCEFLLDALRAISGRLALRLAGSDNATQEMIALALVHSHCKRANKEHEVWLPLEEGFFIPLDDVPELFHKSEQVSKGNGQRADLLYVTATRREGLRLCFIEIKFRRYLKTARAPELIQTIEEQIDSSCQYWEQSFGVKTPDLQKTVNRAWLARILRFYARKGCRHTLSEDAFQRIIREIDRMVLSRETDLPALIDLQRKGFIFCPEYYGEQPAEINHYGISKIWLFGSTILSAPRREYLADTISPYPSSDLSENDKSPAFNYSVPIDEEISPPPKKVIASPTTFDEVNILLGHQITSDEPAIWRTSIKANPHLMILGLPGMGKTTCLINLCQQLSAQNITPIIFSYHQDIDEKLGSQFSEPPLVVRYAGLGFNPLQVNGDSPTAYLDNAGQLRDIFSAIFPELGDVQLGRLREALKQSYHDQGWELGQRGETPAFRNFLDQLRADAKPDKGLRTLLDRLSELDDYGLFKDSGTLPSLLNQTQPVLIEIHKTQNEYMQRAFSTLVLYNLYQNMFQRGTQDRITHAIIFDEAHRASRLKLIPTMVKECRKYGISFVIASQEAKDFDPSLFTAIANYLALRLSETDSRLMAKNFATADKVALYTDRIKKMPKYQGMYYGEDIRTPMSVALLEEIALTDSQ